MGKHTEDLQQFLNEHNPWSRMIYDEGLKEEYDPVLTPPTPSTALVNALANNS